MSSEYQQAWDLDDPDLVSAMDEAPLWSAPFAELLLDTVVLAPSLQVLDIGCGLGCPMLELAQRLGTSSRVVGLDPWRAGTDRLLLKMAQYGVTNAGVVTGVAERMPFQDESFHLVTSNNGLNNVADRSAAWREAFRVARPAAQVVVTENLPDTMIELYDVYERVLEEAGLSDRIAAMREQICDKRRPLDETRERIAACGFEIESIVTRSFALRYLDGTALLGHFLIRLGFIEGFKSILDEEHRAPVFDLLETRLDERAAQLGQLELTVPFACLDCRKPR